MELKLSVDRLSQLSRAVLIFCKANGIEFEKVKIEFTKKHTRTPEFAEINPMQKVPAIVHGDFKLFESHAILIYLASAFPGVADHWYPADVHKRAKIHSVLDWHHSNLRVVQIIVSYSFDTDESCVFGYIFNSAIAIERGLPLNLQAAAKEEKLLSESLAKIESYWLQGDGPFLLGNEKPSIIDLSLVCEVMQPEAADESEHERILSPHKRILKWIEDTKNATTPYFDEIHSIMPLAREKIKELKVQASKP
ncbi:Glutathione S-transferase [Handroanthus impetiginosus]|uniref:Glutathione S-transferase n=1 Tax=Handroanthus impetiginosus TaxID=429701 RepID=A0A2G9GBB6_9LAMI|nr:Glutathione S-transferase [Handroanthus impetiginosus]